MSKPLDGIRVVELGTHVAVPAAARIMAEWGAEVIKVEGPAGDAWRYIGYAHGLPMKKDNNPNFQYGNSNKKDVCLNLKTPEGKEAMMKLLETADVFMTNTRLEALKKLGVDYDSIKKRFPRLIYAHLSGYGLEGPDCNSPGFDGAAFWARSGVLLEWTLEGDRPFKPCAGFGDNATGALFLAAVLAALHKRDQTGEGTEIEDSLYGTALWYNSLGVLKGEPCYGQKFPKTDMSFHTLTPLRQTKDGDWFLIQDTKYDKNVDKYLEFFHLEDMKGVEGMMTVKDSCKHPEVALKAYNEAFARTSTKDLEEFLTANDVPFCKLMNPNDVTKDEQAWANGYLATRTMENGSEVVMSTIPVKFSDCETTEFKLAPQLGENNAEVLSELGYTAEQISKMEESGAIAKK